MKRLLLGAAAAVLVLAALFTSLARADGIDNLRPDPAQSYCADASRTFYHAARARMTEHARKIQAVTHEQIEMMEHGIDFEFPKDAMFSIGWDRLTQADREETEMHAFAGWDSADRTLADMGAIDEDAVKRMARTYLQMCVDGHKAQPLPEAQPEKSSFRRTKGQKFLCENTLPFADLIDRQLAQAGWTHQMLGAISERDLRTIKDVAWCRDAKQPLRECVLRRCMESPA